LCGQSIAGAIVLMPTSRGSCTGSGVLLELIQNGHAPGALVFAEAGDVLTLGAIVAREVAGRTLPVIQLELSDFAKLCDAPSASITADRIAAPGLSIALSETPAGALELSAFDRAMLEGRDGAPVQTAMRIICHVASIQGASRLIDVAQVHID